MSDQQIQKVKVKRLAHIGLWTTDVAAQARFYRQIMGFDLRAAEPRMPGQELVLEDANIFLSLSDESHCLGLFTDTRQAAGNARIPVSHTRLHHMAFEVGTNAELAAFAARLKQANVELTFGEHDSYANTGDTLWFNDPDGNRIAISVEPDDIFTSLAPSRAQRLHLRPRGLQHLALQTSRLEVMVEFYTEALGFDISDWLLRECVWLRCNDDHHTLMLIKGKQDTDHAVRRPEHDHQKADADQKTEAVAVEADLDQEVEREGTQDDKDERADERTHRSGDAAHHGNDQDVDATFDRDRTW